MPSMVKNEASTVYVNSSFQATALLGYSKAMNHLRHQINRVAVTDVMLRGECQACAVSSMEYCTVS